MYEVILLEDLVAAVEKSVDERLWRHVFYTPIEELRAELRKVGGKKNRHKHDTLQRVLLCVMSITPYILLITMLSLTNSWKEIRFAARRSWTNLVGCWTKALASTTK